MRARETKGVQDEKSNRVTKSCGHFGLGYISYIDLVHRTFTVSMALHTKGCVKITPPGQSE